MARDSDPCAAGRIAPDTRPGRAHRLRALSRRLLPAAFACVAAVGLAAPSPSPAPPGRRIVDFYFEPGCSACEQVKSEILPRLAEQYPGRYELREWDLNVQSNYVRLVGVMERLGRDVNAVVYIVVDGRRLLAGFEEIAAGLLAAVGEAPAAETPAPGPPPEEKTGLERLVERLRGFTALGVVSGGLLDGFNPCAFSTLVFFVSLLSVFRMKGGVLLLAGAAFCAASFVTYFALGFGLLSMVRALDGFAVVRRIVDAVMVAALLVLALLSFRDALRFRATRNPADVALQLPEGIKERIHRIMREGLQTRRVVSAGLVIGCLVTLLESVCTGQVYVPTIVYVVRSGNEVARGVGYLALYNLAFILPLVGVFLLTYYGLRLHRLLAWSARNVVTSKALLGVFFLVLAGLIAAL